jgi:hypothetical protein
MKSTWTIFLLAILVLAVVVPSGAGTVRTSGLKGHWSSDTTWVGGILPGATDTAVIADADTVTLDVDTSAHVTIAKLVIGDGTSGALRTSDRKVTSLTVTGDVVVSTGAAFRVQTRDTSYKSDLLHTLTLYGNITNNGTVDFRLGSTSVSPQTLAAMNVVFTGTQNSIVTMNGGYTTSQNEFNSVTIDKTAGANVVLGNDMYVSGGSTAYPNLNSFLIFKHGKIVTGDYAFIHLSTNSASIIGMSDSTYIDGALGRGISTSAAGSKVFNVGDDQGYRPFNVGSTTSGQYTGHHFIVRAVHADANTGSSTLNGISKVSKVRYYKVTYRTVSGTSSGYPPPTMGVSIFGPSYGLDDGIRAGNQNLRVAYSIDDRATWTNIGLAKSHTTNLDSLPRRINPDSVRPYITLDTLNSAVYIALADSSGPNPLDGTVSAFSLASPSLEFGTVEIDSTKWDSIQVNNPGTGQLTIRNHTEVDSIHYETSPSAPIYIPAGGSQMLHIKFHPTTYGSFPSKIIFYHDAPTNPDTLLVNGSSTSQVTMTLNTRWNMIALPVVTANDSAANLFPTAISRMFKYAGSYQQTSVLLPGIGYWLKFAAGLVDTFQGAPITLDTITVNDGWNMVGCLTTKIPVTAVTPVGTTIKSNFFGYKSSYTPADTIVPGSAYWIKVNPAGQLIMAVPAGPAKKSAAVNELTNADRLIIRDAAGNEQTLYFGNNITAGRYELPPVPPEGSFDVRFASGTMAEPTGKGTPSVQSIQLSSAVYPVTITADLRQSGSNARLQVAGKQVALTSGKSVTVGSGNVSLLTGASTVKPSAYALYQNYPNPFNPSTTIAFDLPVDSKVTLAIYNLLGQEVSRIYDRTEMASGQQIVAFNAANLPSGVYFYRLTAENSVDAKSFANVKRMLIVK